MFELIENICSTLVVLAICAVAAIYVATPVVLIGLIGSAPNWVLVVGGIIWSSILFWIPGSY